MNDIHMLSWMLELIIHFFANQKILLIWPITHTVHKLKTKIQQINILFFINSSLKWAKKTIKIKIHRLILNKSKNIHIKLNWILLRKHESTDSHITSQFYNNKIYTMIFMDLTKINIKIYIVFNLYTFLFLSFLICTLI